MGPTPGSFGFGVLTPWEVVPTATISVAAAAALPSIVNAGPTCVSVQFDPDGKITSLDFAAQGDVTGSVTYDSGSGSYIFADRLIVPDFVTDLYPGLGALFVTSYQAGTSLGITFMVDVTTGAFMGLDGNAEFCGAGSVTGSGDGQVGDATIPAAVLDPGDITALEDADGDEVCAAVHTVGVITPESQGEIEVQTDVVITATAPTEGPQVVPTLPNTSTARTVTPSGNDGIVPLLLLSVVLALGIIAATRPRSETARMRR